MHNAHTTVKAKRTYDLCLMHGMTYDDRPEPAKRLQRAREAAGLPSARAAAERFGWNYDTYAQHENGTRGITRSADRYAKAFKVSKAWLLTGEGRGPSNDAQALEEAELSQIYRDLHAHEELRAQLLAQARLYRRLVSGDLGRNEEGSDDTTPEGRE